MCTVVHDYFYIDFTQIFNLIILFLPLTTPSSASINRKSPFPLPSASPIVETITSPLGRQCVVCKADTFKACTSFGSIVYTI